MDISTVIFLLVLAWISLNAGHIFIALILAVSAIFAMIGSASQKVIKRKSSPQQQQIIVGGGGSFPTKFKMGVRPDWPAKPTGYWMNEGVVAVFETIVKLFEKSMGAD